MESQDQAVVSYCVIDSRIGPLLVAATDNGLVRVAFEREEFDQVIAELAELLSAPVAEKPTQLTEYTGQILEYLAGDRRDFDFDLDHSLSHGFQREVHEQLRTIEYGSTQTYQEVATKVGNPNAVRAVGTACGANPIPIVVPCHRVVRTDGSLGGYRGGLDIKTKLLELERP